MRKASTALRVIAVSVGVVGLLNCSSPTKRGTFQTTKGVIAVALLESAAGATRLEASESGRYVLAEFEGDWRGEAFPSNEGGIPPVFKVIDLATRDVIETGNGWALGAPNDNGDVIYIEEFDEEYNYRLRSTKRPALVSSIATPSSVYVARWGGRTSSAAIAVFSVPVANLRKWPYRDSLMIASIDPASLRVRSTTIIEGMLPLEPFAAGRGGLFIARFGEPNRTWSITRFDGETLAETWATQVKRPEGTAGEQGRIELTAEGRGLVVISGDEDHFRVLPKRITRLDVVTGKHRSTFTPPLESTWAVQDTANVPGRSALALLHTPETKNTGLFFQGLSLLDVEDEKLVDVLDVSRAYLGDRYEALANRPPSALLCRRDLTVWLAPAAGFGRGLESPPIKGLVTIPRGWHVGKATADFPARPRVQARADHIEALRSKSLKKE